MKKMEKKVAKKVIWELMGANSILSPCILLPAASTYLRTMSGEEGQEGG